MAARYIEIKNSIRDDILNNRYRMGEKIPSERELSLTYGVTRVTLQKSMHLLEQEGFIERIHGKGMFVTRTITDDLYELNSGTGDSFLGFSREFNQVEVSSRLICHQLSFPSPSIARQLEMQAEHSVHFIRRVRLIDKTPVLVEDSWINAAVIASIPDETLNGGSLYEYIETYTGKKIKFYNSVIEGDLFSEEMSNLLGISPGMPMLKVSGITKLEDGTAFNYSIGYNRADKFKIKNSWVGK
ncbi:GntR family transcriptional regulator [Enterobacter huaxiensis]|uniref:GntR family transcriptional regulator n=1 Tax=Enterobacter huaxiensis TaxID=2494702 RepID=UPI002175E34B|nr:GntR family transcriptional regulator [Enterobacter huaxiensis]MCS5452099.1 GntR family transcriptional regulator [Enterobacter huaxiensis]MEB7583440.1 GntR family transcriptional regulator [Enterobacter huaxiensis]MEB7665641.1 GntR family transcriptional regulator [Enterobacter huaxiensis]